MRTNTNAKVYTSAPALRQPRHCQQKQEARARTDTNAKVHTQACICSPATKSFSFPAWLIFDFDFLWTQGIKLGVSSRGWASLRTDAKAKCVFVDDDFELITFDFVTEPSTTVRAGKANIAAWLRAG